MGLFSNGLAEVLAGPIAVDGGMGTVLTNVGKILEDSFSLVTEDGNTVTFNSEESDDPEFERKTGKTLGFQFTIMDPTVDTLVRFMGGTKGADDQYEAPDKTPVIELSVQIKPEMGLGFDVVRLSVDSSFTDQVGKNNLMGIVVNGKILKPKKAGVKKFTMPVYP